jgi:hypothetical protein
MLTKRSLLILWISYAALMGILVGGSIDYALFAPQNYSGGTPQNTAADEKSFKEREQTTNEALADYTKWLMRYTGLLFLATLGMGIATLGLYASGQDQIRLAREEFLSTHRPKLVIRNVHIVREHIAGWPVGSSFGVRYDLVNVGDTPATIVGTTMEIQLVTSTLLAPSPSAERGGSRNAGA